MYRYRIYQYSDKPTMTLDIHLHQISILFQYCIYVVVPRAFIVYQEMSLLVYLLQYQKQQIITAKICL